MGHGWISVLAVAMAVFATPLFLDLALCVGGNLFKARRPRTGMWRTIRLAVVVPAHDEEAMIARTVRSLRAADADTPVYVVAHNCSDGTARAAAEAGAEVVELNNRKLRGKGAALREGFTAAAAGGANAFLVVDADTVVSPNLVAATQELLSHGADATQCRYELELPAGISSPKPMMRLRALAFRGMNVVRARGRAGLGLSTGLFGNGFALTAEALKRVPFDANSIAEDVEYHTRWFEREYRCSGRVKHLCMRTPRHRARHRQHRKRGGRAAVYGLQAARRGDWVRRFCGDDGAHWRRWRMYGACPFREGFWPCF